MKNLPGTDLNGWYERGQYTFSAPPVCTIAWQPSDWARYVTPNQAAPYPLAPIVFGSITLYHTGFDAKGKPTYSVPEKEMA